MDGYEYRRAAILHRAFTGELTAKWRAEHKIPDDARQNVTVASLCLSLKYGTAKKSVGKGKLVVLRMGNLQNGEIDWSNLAYSNDEEDNKKCRLNAGDVLFNRTNSAELVGKAAIYRGEYPAIYAGYLIRLDYDHERVSGEYLNYMLNSPVAYEYCRKVKTDGVNQSNINARKIGSFVIPLPSIEEQARIVQTVSTLLIGELKVKTAAETVLTTIDTMKKAILGRAFRGLLGTNRPEEPRAEI